MQPTRLVRLEVQALTPYSVLTFPNCQIRMDANENPYNLPLEIRQLLSKEMAGFSFNRYPDSEAQVLREVISVSLEVDKDMIILGNGSDELILYLLLTMDCQQVVYPLPTFAMYRLLGEINRLKPMGIPLGQGFKLDEQAILSSANQKQSIIFLSYPNNPTGNCFLEEKIIRIIENTSSLVIVDEAYYAFSKKSFLPLLERYKNLAILRSLSKIGLAGLRVGYLVAPSELVSQLLKVKLPYNLNSFSQLAAKLMLQNMELINPQLEQIIQERERMLLQMNRLEGLLAYPSQANFILFQPLTKDSQTVFSQLIERGILIRHLPQLYQSRDYLRVTVGSPEENEAFISSLREILR